MKDIVYLNGQYIPRDQATISVMDRGFLFADSVYEVIPIFHQRLVGMTPHLKRLNRSLAAICMSPPLSLDQWENIIKTVIAHNKNTSNQQAIYIQVTRGAQKTRRHAIPTDYQPTILVMHQTVPIKSIDDLAQGFSAITVEDRRRKDCYVKSTALLPNILAHHQAQQQNALDAILIRDNQVTEATSSNVFIVNNNQLTTPPLSDHILGGITRDIILSIAKANQMTYQENTISLNELYKADEVWLSGSTKEICPITSIDNKPIGSGQTGPLWHTIIKHYQHFKETGNYH